VPVTQPQNGGRASSPEVEMSLEQQLRSLPAPWNGFGYGLNYTYQVSEADYQSGLSRGPKTTQISRMPRGASGTPLCFMRSRVSKRGCRPPIMTNTSKDLRDFAMDKWVQGRTNLDFRLSYRFAHALAGFIRRQNLTDEPVYGATRGPMQGFQKDSRVSARDLCRRS